MMTYVDSCAGCAISQELRHTAGGIVKLSGDWIINQCSGGEGVLCWLTLQPRFHSMAVYRILNAGFFSGRVFFLARIPISEAVQAEAFREEIAEIGK